MTMITTLIIIASVIVLLLLLCLFSPFLEVIGGVLFFCIAVPVCIFYGIADTWAKYRNRIRAVLLIFGAIIVSVAAFSGEVVLAGSFLTVELIFLAAIFIAVLVVAVLYYTAPLWGPLYEKLQKNWSKDKFTIITPCMIGVIPVFSAFCVQVLIRMQEATPSNPGF